jgi:thiosulfate/3-mercaptopyruvate sulfurtransferase
MIRVLVFLFTGLMILSGCQQKPTKVTETSPAQISSKAEQSIIKLTDKTIILDARPPLEYDLFHIPRSISIQWQDFIKKDKLRPERNGLLDTDLNFHARRLARYGIGPDSDVVVVGNGLKGQGEEGRIAWTLFYMGVKNVKFSSIDTFSLPKLRNEIEGYKPHPIWDVNLDSSMLVDRKLFLSKSMRANDDKDRVYIFDVRTEKDYLRKGPSLVSKTAPDIGAINIPWTEFLNQFGEPSEKAILLLKELNINFESEIYIIDEDSVKSAAVAAALESLGFKKVRHFLGGYVYLMEDLEPKRTTHPRDKKSRR